MKNKNFFFLDKLKIIVESLMDMKNLATRKRTAKYMMARQLFINYAVTHGLTKSEVARFLNRNHATIINAYKQSLNYLQYDKKFLEYHNKLINSVEKEKIIDQLERITNDKILKETIEKIHILYKYQISINNKVNNMVNKVNEYLNNPSRYK